MQYMLLYKKHFNIKRNVRMKDLANRAKKNSSMGVASLTDFLTQILSHHF